MFGMFPITRLEPFEVLFSDSGYQAARPPLTVYPLTVEFDRLLRRQQQLERNTCHRYRATNGNSSRSSISSDLSSSATEFSSPLENVNANELFFSTLIHYYANLNSSHAKLSELSSYPVLMSTGGGVGNGVVGGNSSVHCPNNNSNGNNVQYTNKHNFPMDEIFRTIASPGTRTILFVIDKLDTIKLLGEQLKQSNRDQKSSNCPCNCSIKLKQQQTHSTYHSQINNQYSNQNSHHQNHHSQFQTQSQNSNRNLKTKEEKEDKIESEKKKEIAQENGGDGDKVKEDEKLAKNSNEMYDEVSVKTTISETNECLELRTALSASQRQQQNHKQEQSHEEHHPEHHTDHCHEDVCDYCQTNRSRQIVSIIFGDCRMHLHDHQSAIRRNSNFLQQQETTSQYPTVVAASGHAPAGNHQAGAILEGQSRPIQHQRTPAPSLSQQYYRKQSRDLDEYLAAALQRKRTLIDAIQCCRPLSNDQCTNNNNNNSNNEGTLEQQQQHHLFPVGVEQQIIGAITFYKSYRLTGTKIVESPFISVHPLFRRLGLGSRLVRCVKQCGQIGPYDAIRVRIDSSRADLRRFFLANEFSDDLILNASFDQLHSVYSDGDEDDDEEEEDGDSQVRDDAGEDDGNIREEFGANLNGNSCDDFIPYSERKTKDAFSLPRDCSLRGRANIAHSVSFGSFYQRHSSQQPQQHHHRRARHGHHHHFITNTKRRPSGRGRDCACKLISLCYLPPFAASTAIVKSIPNGTLPNLSVVNSTAGSGLKLSELGFGGNSLVESLDDFGLESQALLDEIENRQVDDMIEEAHRLWRRELLSAYRTQWSCVARLRAEIVRLRKKLQECEETIGGLKKDNHQLRTSLLQNESKINSQKHLFLLKNFNFDSMDF